MQSLIVSWVQSMRLIVEFLGACMIALGTFLSLYQLSKQRFTNHHADFKFVRITLSKYLVLALEFQLAADILSTAIAPGWEEIGKLSTIVVIRTGMNYFIALEQR